MADDTIDFDATFGIQPSKPASTKGKPGAGTGGSKEAIPTEPDQSSTWGDHAYDLASKGLSTISDVGNAARFAADAAGMKDTGSVLSDVVGAGYKGAQALGDQMTEQGKKNRDARATDLGPDGMLARPKGSQAISALNSTLPSMAVMGVGSVAGPVGAYGALYGMELGSINRSVYDELIKASPEELNASPRYKELRQEGNSHDRAVQLLADETGRGLQLGGAAAAAALDMAGPVGGMVMARAGIKSAAKRIAKDGIVKAVGKEVGTEATQSAIEEGSKQAALNQDWGVPYQPGEVVEQAVKGGVTAVPAGAGAHMVGGGHSRNGNVVTDDQNAALEQTQQEAISTDPSEPVTAPVDRIMEKAKQVAQPAAPVAAPAAPPVTEGPVPQQEAIPTERPSNVIQGPSQQNSQPLQKPMYVQGRDIMNPQGYQEGPPAQNGRGPEGAIHAQQGNPVFAEQQGPSQPQSAARPASQELEAMPFLQAMADENHGVVDPARIAGYLSQRGQSATWQQVTQELAPLVERGILQQSTIPGPNGQPVFTMATERQGPQPGPTDPRAPSSVEPGFDPMQARRENMLNDNGEGAGSNRAPSTVPAGFDPAQARREQMRAPAQTAAPDVFAEKRDAMRPGEQDLTPADTSVNPFDEKRDAMRPGEMETRPANDQPQAPARPTAGMRRAAAQAGPKAQKIKALAEKRKAEKKAPAPKAEPAPVAPATAPVPAGYKVRAVGANAEQAKGEIGALLAKLPGNEPKAPPPAAPPAAPAARKAAPAPAPKAAAIKAKSKAKATAASKTVKLYRGEPVVQESPKAHSHPGVFFYGEKDKASTKGYTRAVHDNSMVGAVREASVPAETMSRLADLNNDAQYNELVPKKSERSQKHTRGVMPTKSMVENLRKKGLKGFRWTDDSGKEQIFLIPEVAESLKYDPLPEQAKQEAPSAPAKAPVLERRVERQVLRTAQKIETSSAPEPVKAKWRKGLKALEATLSGMKAARINAPFDEKGHYKDKVAPAAEKATPDSVRAQRAADKAATAAAAHRDALAKLEAAHEEAARPTKSKGARTTRIKKLAAARKAEAEARAASEEAAKEHRRASLLFEGSRAALGATAEAVPPLKAQYAGKYTPEDVKVESEWSPDDQPVEAPYTGPRANDLLGDKHELAAARAEVRAAKFGDTVDGLRRRMEALPEGKEFNKQRAELDRQIKDMEYAAELAHDRATELRERAKQAKGEQVTAPGKPISDQEVLKRVTKRAQQSDTIAHAAEQHGMTVDDMVSMVMADIKRELDGHQTAEAVDRLPFTELFNRARIRAQKLARTENRGGALQMVRDERARVDRGHNIRYDSAEDVEAARKAEQDAAIQEELTPANPDPDARFSHGLPRYTINEDGEIVENPVRRAADQQQDPNREAEAASAAAERAENRAERLQGYLAKSGLGSSADQTKMARSGAARKNGFRAAMAGFMNEDGSLKKWEHINRAANRIFSEFKGANKDVPGIVRDIVLHGRDIADRRAAAGRDPSKGGKLTRAEQGERQKLLDRLQQGEWDHVAGETFNAAREAAVARTPISIFENHAPENGIADESLAEQTDRLNAMAKDFVALQNSGFNMDGKQARTGAVKSDPYLKFMRDLIRMTEGGTKPLTYTEVPLAEGKTFSKTAVEERNKRFRAKHAVQSMLSEERVLRSGDEQNSRYSQEKGASFNDQMDANEDTGPIHGTTWRSARRMASMEGMYARSEDPGVIDHSMSGAEALQAAWPHPDPVVKSLVDTLSERVGNTPVHVVSANEMEQLAEGRNASMLYDPDTGQIYVRQGLDAGTERAAILEELWHAATAEAIYNDPELRAMGTELQRVFAAANPGYAPEHMRYFSELGELSAHGLLNPEFKARADGIALPAKVAERLGVRPKTSLLQAIFQRVLRFLGVAPQTKEASLLEGIMHWNQKLYEATRPGGGIDQAPGRALASMADLPVLGKVARTAATTASNQTPAILKTTLGLMYTTDMVQRFQHLFHFDTGKKYLRLAGATDPLHQADLASRKRAALTKRLEQADGPMLDRHRALVSNDPKAATAMHNLALDATTVGIDPSRPTPPARAAKDNVNGRRAKQQYEQLRARYLGLTPEARAVFDGMRDNVKAKANAVARAALIDIARRRWQNAQDKNENIPGMPAQPLSPMQERELADRLLRGDDTFADRQLMGEGGMAFAHEYASAVNSPTFYLPKTRTGEFVITGNRTDYQSENYFDTEAEAEAFANKAEADGVPVMYDIAQTGVAPDGTRVNRAEVENTPGAQLKYRVKLQTQITEMFETKSEAIARQKEYAKLKNVRISGVETRKRGKNSYMRDIPPELQAQITKRIESMASSDEDKAYLSDLLQDALVQFMPGANMRHATIKRRNVLGASQDMLTAMGKHTVSAAQYLGSLEYGAYQRAATQAMEDVIDRERFTARGKAQNLTRLAITGELRHRQNVTDADGEATSSLMRGVQRYVAVHYLASPSYALLQLTQTPLMGPGVMARLFPNASDAEIIGALGHGHNAVGGYAGTFAALGKDKFVRAWQKYRDDHPKNVEFLQRVKDNVAETNPAMAKEYGALLDEMARRGVIDETAGLEIQQMVKDLNAGALKKGWTLIEDLSRAFPAAAEVYNRSSVAVGAYKLARDKGMSVEQATELADQAILGIHFDYSAQNAPRLMNEANKKMGGVLTPFLTFKKYVAAVYGQMALSFENAIRGETPEVRRAARRQFSRMMIAHGMAAGVMGLPWEGIKLAMGVAAFLAGKDQPWDFDDDIQKALIAKFGGGPDAIKWANVVMHGLPQLVNADIGDRVGLESLLFGRGPDDFSPPKIREYAANLIMGAAGGAFGGLLLGAKTIRDTGNVRKGAEQMAPKFVRDALSAWEIAEGGKKNAKGEDITEGLLGPADAVWKGLGFTSALEKNLQRERTNRFQEQKQATTEKQRLHKAYIKAEDAGDQATMERIQSQIDQHNANHPDYPVTPDSLKAARRQLAPDASKKFLGVPVPKTGLSPSIYVPQLSRERIERGREIGAQTSSYVPTKDQLTSPAMSAITSASNEHPLFANIIKAEGTDRRGDPYNEVLGYGKYGEPPKPLTQMTLAEVYDFGLSVRHRHGSSSAMGAFQIVGQTMKEYMGEAGLSWNDKFTPENQRKLALVIAENQGVRPSTWEGFRRNPVLLAKARQAFKVGGFDV